MCHFIIYEEQVTYYVHILHIGMHEHTLLNHSPQGIQVNEMKLEFNEKDFH